MYKVIYNGESDGVLGEQCEAYLDSCVIQMPSLDELLCVNRFVSWKQPLNTLQIHE